MDARWVEGEARASDAFVWRFRCELLLEAVPEAATLRLTADPRYRLVVNGQRVDEGPQRGGLDAWPVSELDLAPYLRPGINEIDVFVFDFGSASAMWQISHRPGLWVESDLPGLRTPGEWQVSGQPISAQRQGLDLAPTYLVTSPNEHQEGATPWFWPDGWPESSEAPVRVMARGKSEGQGEEDSGWWLVPRTVQIRENEVDAPVWRVGADEERIPLAPGTAFGGHLGPLLLDLGELRTGRPELSVEGAGGKIAYAEAMFDGLYGKSHRQVTKGKTFRGHQDSFRFPNGHGHFSPVMWRTGRYLLLQAEETSRLQTFRWRDVGAPYNVEARFETEDEEIQRIWEVSLRTARLCATDLYQDCPYYEELQYVGDTRIQALLESYLSPDRARQRNALWQFARTQRTDGLFETRFPAREPQIIPGFCLWWVMMLHDWWQTDPASLEPGVMEEYLTVAYRALRGVQRLASAPEDRQFWCYADWNPAWPWGVPPGGARSLTYRLLWSLCARCYDVMADWANDRGRRDLNGDRFRRAGSVRPGRLAQRGPGGWLQPKEAGVIGTACELQEAYWRLLHKAWRMPVPAWTLPVAEEGQAASLHQLYYVHESRPREDYLPMLDPWRRLLAEGLTTWPEIEVNPRSDCHAWSAHPALSFLRRVAGVRPAAAGWARCRIEPVPGSMLPFTAEIPHPQGAIRVGWDGKRVDVDCPVPFTFVSLHGAEDCPAGRILRER